MRLALLVLGLACALVAPARAQGPAPATFKTGDGAELTIQREWAVEQDPAPFAKTKLDQQPFRFDQRQPKLVHTEQRAGHEPLYYFDDCRWKQEDRPAGASFGRRAYFTSVKVDLEKLKAAYFCLKPFAPRLVAGHTAVYVELEPGGITTLDGESAPGFVVSYEAYLRVTQEYKLIGGQMAKYRVIYVVSPWRDFLMRSVQFNGSFVKRWKLALNADELHQLALAIGRTLGQDQSAVRYNTLSLSCVTAALDLIDEAVPESRRVKKSWVFGLLKNPGYALPALSDDALRAKGLLEGAQETFDKVPPEEPAR